MPVCSPQALLSEASCYSCLPGGVLQPINTALLCNILKVLNPMATCDVQTLLDNARCFECLPAGELALIQTSLLCQINNNIGGGGGGGAINNDVIYNTTDPTTENLFPPDLTRPSLAYKRDGTGAVFGWDPIGGAWH